MFLIETIFKLIAPYECMGCGLQGSLICAECLQTSVNKAPINCFKCNKTRVESRICEKCRRETGIDRVWVATKYGGATKHLIKKLKFERAEPAVEPLAKLLADALPDPNDDFLITYVPTATSRVRERGYDHARQLAKEYARLRGRKIHSLLTRHGQVRQVGASRYKRQRQLSSAFAVKRNGLVTGKIILLIDDVVTTGATIEAATKVLINAGAKSVSAMVVAQKQ